MTEQIMNKSSLSSYLIALINTEMVRVRTLNKTITIEAVDEKEYNCPLLGAAKGTNLTVEKFLSMTREDNENESW